MSPVAAHPEADKDRARILAGLLRNQTELGVLLREASTLDMEVTLRFNWPRDPYRAEVALDVSHSLVNLPIVRQVLAP